MKEIWKDVKDPMFKDYYEISDMGRLRTKGRNVTRGGENNRYTYWKSPKIVSSRRSKKHPHLFTSLYADDIRNRTKYIHKLVAEAFLKKPSKEHIFVTHIDDNYDNNCVTNLKWITASENSKSNIEKYPENGLKLKNRNIETGYYDMLKLNIWKKKHSKRIIKMRSWGVSVKELARIYGCSEPSIYNLLRKAQNS